MFSLILAFRLKTKWETDLSVGLYNIIGEPGPFVMNTMTSLYFHSQQFTSTGAVNWGRADRVTVDGAVKRVSERM
jgi:hypothetical protein